MKFDGYAFIMHPFTLMFIAIFTGLLFGKVKFGKRFSFGASGALFTGLALGFILTMAANNIVEQGEATPGYAAAEKLISTGVVNSQFLDFSLIFFVAAIGLLASKDVGVVLRKYGAKFVALGFIITFVGAAGSFAGMQIFKDSVGTYEFSGVYVGALTSSPGLGAALETAEVQATMLAEDYENLNEAQQARILDILGDDDTAVALDGVLSQEEIDLYATNAVGRVATGYSVAYPFGVIIVIFAVSFFASIFRMNVDEEKKKFAREMEEAKAAVASRKSSSGKVKKEIPVVPFSMISFALVVFVGYALGMLKIFLGPLGWFSLGSTGGVLIVALVFGSIGKIGPFNFRMETKTVGFIRDIALIFFLCIVGLRYGYVAINSLVGSGLAIAIGSIIVGFLALFVGFLIGRYVFKLNWVILSGAICGGMTSTPGLGACVDAIGSDDPASGYGATYPFALLGMIIFTIILNQIPIA